MATNEATNGDDESKYDAEIDGLKTKQRFGNDFTVDVIDTDDERKVDPDEDKDYNLLIQGAPGGYQLTLWWSENGLKHQSDLHVDYGEQNHDYPHDNDHDRDADITAEDRDGQPAIVIHDPDPRADKVGYDGADIIITRHDDGYLVALEWVDEMGNQQRVAQVSPTFDPRKDEHRDQYYDYILPVESTLDDFPTGEEVSDE